MASDRQEREYRTRSTLWSGGVLGIGLLTCIFPPTLYAVAVFHAGSERGWTLLYERKTGQVATVSPPDIVHRWTLLYGRKTVEAAALTTQHFRKGKSEKSWGEQIQRALGSRDFLHLGGQVIEQRILEETAILLFISTLRTDEGSSKQVERYTLKWLGGQWLIDRIEVVEEIIPVDVLERLIPGQGE